MKQRSKAFELAGELDFFVMAARKTSSCIACGESISRGMQMGWSDKYGSIHHSASCYERLSVDQVSAPKGTSRNREVVTAEIAQVIKAQLELTQELVSLHLELEKLDG